MSARAQAVTQAGSDVALHCSGELAEMEAVAAGVPTLHGAALRRFNRCIEVLGDVQAFDQSEAERLLARVLALPQQMALKAGA